jgi:hypothetical protein
MTETERLILDWEYKQALSEYEAWRRNQENEQDVDLDDDADFDSYGDELDDVDFFRPPSSDKLGI